MAARYLIEIREVGKCRNMRRKNASSYFTERKIIIIMELFRASVCSVCKRSLDSFFFLKGGQSYGGMGKNCTDSQ